MKKKFSVFYEDDKVDFNKLDDGVLIVLDANILLHFFRYSEKSKDKLFKALEKVKDNIFVPYHAAVEYHFGRQSVDRSNDKNKEKLDKSLNDEKEKFVSGVKEAIKTYGNNIRSKDEESVREEVIKKFTEKLNQFWSDFKENDLVEEISLISDNSNTLVRIGNLLDSKVGERLDNIAAIEKDGKNRYGNMIPPGYKDLKEKEDRIRSFGKYKYSQKYGDLILWNEIIEHCKKNPRIKHVFLITDDQKEDWVYKVDGKTIGARVELKQELYEVTKAKFDIMGTNTFLMNVINQSGTFKKENHSLFLSNDITFNINDNSEYNNLIKFINTDSFENIIIKDNLLILNDVFHSSKYLLNELETAEEEEKDSLNWYLQEKFASEFESYIRKMYKVLDSYDNYEHIRSEIEKEHNKIESNYYHYYLSGDSTDKAAVINILIKSIEHSPVYKKYRLI